MRAISAGLLLYRVRTGATDAGANLEVLLVHPGGPMWARKQEGAWTIPKGEVHAGEELLDAARREFKEETGLSPEGPFIPLKPVRLKSGKIIHAWAVEGDCNPAALRSNVFELEWPPRSGRVQTCPEVDEARFCTIAEARRLLNPAQVALVEELAAMLAKSDGSGGA